MIFLAFPRMASLDYRSTLGSNRTNKKTSPWHSLCADRDSYNTQSKKQCSEFFKNLISILCWYGCWPTQYLEIIFGLFRIVSLFISQWWTCFYALTKKINCLPPKPPVIQKDFPLSKPSFILGGDFGWVLFLIFHFVGKNVRSGHKWGVVLHLFSWLHLLRNFFIGYTL